MVELLYGAKNFSAIADNEIREGRAVSFRFTGWRRPWVYRALAMYAEHDRVSHTGSAPRKLSLGLAWRVLLAPTLFGLIHQARSNGMGLLVRDTGTSLEVRLEPSNNTPHTDARGNAVLHQPPSARAGGRGR
jgi:hypothetical protein